MREFWLVILDDDKKEFSIEGPMTNDDPWNAAVCAAQKAGRAVRCTSPDLDASQGSRNRILQSWIKQGYKEAAGPLVSPAKAL